jgi:serine/threonine protein kinase
MFFAFVFQNLVRLVWVRHYLRKNSIHNCDKRSIFIIFSAPEVMQDSGGNGGHYGPKADVWSLGAILYVMTYGQPPPYSSRAAEPPLGQMPSRDRALVDMLRRTLVLDPHRRANITSVLRHPYTRR